MQLILLVLSFGCFAVSAWPGSDGMWRRLISVGLALLLASMIPWPR